MSLLNELRARRVPQYLGGYLVAGWGIAQFLEFIEGRMGLSPHLVNLIILGLLLLLPSVLILAWSHGKPGRDTWGRAEKFAIPLNVICGLVLLAVLFHGKELGAVTTTISLEDENGRVSERAVPKQEFRKRLALYPLATRTGNPQDDWLGGAVSLLLANDLSQDLFVDVIYYANLAPRLLSMGYESGRNLPRAVQRKIAREAQFNRFLDGSVTRQGSELVIELELHDSDSGKRLQTRRYQGEDLFVMIDECAVQLRRDLGVPEALLAESQDLPVDELVSDSLPAVARFTEAADRISFANDWAGAVAPLEEAVQLDPTFALAQHLLYAVHTTLGNVEKANAAIEATMANLYRLPERTQFVVKAFYYFDVEQDADKALAVVKMWQQLYPNDAEAPKQEAFFLELRGDWEGAIAAYQRVLEIDPLQSDLLRQIGGIYQRLGDFERAESHYRQYADLHPNDALAFSDLTDLYESFGKLAEAQAACEKALLIDPSRVGSALDLARLQGKQGDFELAHASYLEVLARDLVPRDRASALEELMQLCRSRGQLTESIGWFEPWSDAAKEAYPPLEFALRKAADAELLAEAGRSAEARAMVDELVANMPPPLDAMLAIGHVNISLVNDEIEGVEPLLTRIEEVVQQLKVEVWRPMLLQRWGLLEEKRGNFEAALEHYRRGIATAPLSASFYRRAGRCQRELGVFNEAEELLQRALELEPAQPRSHYEMALFYEAKADAAAAARHVEQALLAWQDADPGYERAQLARELQSRLATTP